MSANPHAFNLVCLTRSVFLNDTVWVCLVLVGALGA